MRALFWPLFAWSAWAQLATVVAGMKDEGSVLAFVRLVFEFTVRHCVADMTFDGSSLATVLLVGMGSANHCLGGNN
jgi:hypothetical protein